MTTGHKVTLATDEDGLLLVWGDGFTTDEFCGGIVLKQDAIVIPAAELDTLVAEAEARGARKATQEVNNIKLLADRLSTCPVTLWDTINGAYYRLKKANPDIQAHTQRQRDEGYNEGVKASAEAMKDSWDAGNKERVVTILALRRVDKTPDKG